MAGYKAGDLSAFLQKSNPSAVALPKVKVQKKSTVTVQDKPKENVKQKPKVALKEQTKKLKKQKKFGAAKRLSDKGIPEEGVGKKKKKKAQTTDVSDNVSTQNIERKNEKNKNGKNANTKKNVGKQRNKYKKSAKEGGEVTTGEQTVELSPGKGSKKIVAKTDKNDGHESGFSPPSGIIHESLAKKGKKRKKEGDKSGSPSKKVKTHKDDADSDDGGEGLEQTDSTDTTKGAKKTRLRKDRLVKLTDPRTVFVGNLPLEVKKKHLMKLFKEYGEIEAIRYRCVPVNDPNLPKKVVAIKKEFHPERHNCVAYIRFKEVEQAEKSIALNGKKLHKLHIRVDMASRSKQKDTKKSVFVGNLPFDIEEEAVREHFEDCGTVDSVRIIRDKKTCLGKGFGYVAFQDDDAVSFAMKLNGSKLKGREIRVNSCLANTGTKKTKPGKGGKSDKTGKSTKFRPSNVAKSPFQGEIAKKDKKKPKANKKSTPNLMHDKKDKSKQNDNTEKQTKDPKPVSGKTKKIVNVGDGNKFEKKDVNLKGDSIKGKLNGSFQKKTDSSGKFSNNKSFDKSNSGFQNRTFDKKPGSPNKSFGNKAGGFAKKPDFQNKTFEKGSSGFGGKPGFQNRSFDKGSSGFGGKPGFQNRSFDKGSSGFGGKPGFQNRSFDKSSFVSKPGFQNKSFDKGSSGFGGKPGFQNRSFDKSNFGSKQGFQNKSFGGRPSSASKPPPSISIGSKSGKHTKFD